MPSANVSWPIPLIRQKIFWPGQVGVQGTDNTRGLRADVGGVVFWVDPNAVGVSDLRDGTDPEAPLATVAAALLLAQPYRGDVIAVMANGAWQYAAGVYRTTAIAEEVIVTVPGVRIVGVFPSSSVGVVWQSQTNGTPCIDVRAIDVTIEGFAFSGNVVGGTAIYCEWDGTDLWGENLTVRNCLFDETIDIAIHVDFSWFCDFHHNTFSQCDTYGIYSPAAGSGIAFCAIHDNIFRDCEIAMALLGGADDNEIFGNSIYNSNAQSAAVATNEGLNTTGGARNQVYDNYFSCLLPAAANGDWDDLNTAAATDSWLNCHCLNGDTVTNPT